VHSVRGNLNNRIGVPMVLFGLEPSHRLAAVEIGTNLRGEVAEIASFVEPDIGIVTLIDLEHAAGIGDLDDVEAEEGDLFAAIAAGGVAIANGDDARASRQLARSRAGARLRYGFDDGADYRIVHREAAGLKAVRVHIERRAFGCSDRIALEAPLVGAPGALAVAAAVAAADAAHGAPLTEEAFARVSALPMGEPGRLSPVALADGSLVLDDSYNANPASVVASIEAAAEIARARSARLVLVLGEMRELGAESEEQHDRVGRAIGGGSASVVVAVSGDAARFVGPARAAGADAVFAEDSELALDLVRSRLLPGDVVLVKASRGVRAERVVEGIVGAKGRAG
jgi:UDP-N-acetylmuramoyl-tripeptide--D-alanyl-D-alanine ligase